MIEIGCHVRMTEAFKVVMLGPCGQRGYHEDNGPEENCHECSSSHIIEFGNCVGKVINIDYYGDIEVKWLPDALTYKYDKKSLQLTNLVLFT